MDLDGSDIFVHSDDLLKAGVSKDILKSPKQGYIIRYSQILIVDQLLVRLPQLHRQVQEKPQSRRFGTTERVPDSLLPSCHLPTHLSVL
jgi:hypothetical protein